MRCSATVLPSPCGRCCCSESIGQLLPVPQHVVCEVSTMQQQSSSDSLLGGKCEGTALACRRGAERVQRRRAPGLCGPRVRPGAARTRRPWRRVRQRLRRPLCEQRGLRHVARALRLVQLPLPAAPVQPARCEAAFCAARSAACLSIRSSCVHFDGCIACKHFYRRQWPRL